MNGAFPLTRLIGRVLLFLSRCAAAVLSFALLTVPFGRGGFQEMSDGIYGSEAPLMGSNLLDFLVQPWISVLFAFFMLAYVYIRFRYMPIARRRLGDLSYLAVVSALMMGFQLAFYLPVVKAPAV
ncbi:hypothetical protein [Marinobacter fuscus]|nr:hypothetical protein [Marinobacter fuscus]